ncbi:MAG: flagellar hook-associated protein FlgK [Desulfobacteraceae bacterium]|nr:flagellar hook-associated protein FlgK [Desulfobacteraceae bacterium]MDH3573229.1 flagellar hook-associated protein FlgK [Desulfobacteraceae bacterium]MDH3720121.1 flagellar hook-associated protein FlgK [Desulfobacteraceae bacterium]MDH3836185.1 flagellar hook-associated protein FlgK [Desulfobacteraceae bacterium]MDH3873920.1 flagellar hook-associated protein FlgK [Desulfobacteraceae bacterium]
MSNIGMVLNIATTALNAQQYGMGVTAQNIANVNTEGYSRQSPVLVAEQPLLYEGLLLGRGVDTEQVSRSSDQFIENKLMREKSSMLSSSEMEKYMQVLEGFFNENSGTSISTMVSEFWNGWYDISNNPSGASERISLYEQSLLLSEQFNALGTDLIQIDTDLTGAVTSGIETINKITHEIAQVNVQIVSMEANNVANDLRDKRNTLVSELNEYLDVKAFEQSDGSLTIVAARGSTLVQGNSNYNLEMGGSNGDRVIWQDSGGGYVDITNHLSNGKLGGWLDIRDEIIAKNQLDLDALAKEFIWSVNQQHTQGVGLEGFSTVTGKYRATDTSAAMDSTGLSFADKIVDGDFRLCLYDSNGNYDIDATLSIDADVTSIDDIATAINAIDVTMISATVVDNKLQISGVNGYEFAFSDDNSNVLAALGINTFFTGSSAGNMGVNDVIGLNKNNIAAAQVASDGSMASGDNNNALAITDLQSATMSISQWTCDRINGNTQGSIISTTEDYYHSMVGTIGIVSASVSRDRSFGEMMVNELSTIRDSISAVSLDEEMTNLIKFQHAYAAAAKLIGVADEMLNTLLELK